MTRAPRGGGGEDWGETSVILASGGHQAIATGPVATLGKHTILHSTNTEFLNVAVSQN